MLTESVTTILHMHSVSPNSLSAINEASLEFFFMNANERTMKNKDMV